MRMFLLGGAVAAAAIAYLAWSYEGTGYGDDGDYRYARFDLGIHWMQVDVGSRRT